MGHVSRRVFCFAVVAIVLLSTLAIWRAQGEPARVAQAPTTSTTQPAPTQKSAEEVVGQLLGPMTPLGTPKSLRSIKAFDRLQLAGADQFRPGGVRDPFASPGAYPGDANYYDLAFTLFQVYYRTGDPKWREAARTAAIKWRDSASGDLTMWRRKLKGEYGFPGEEALPAPRGASTLGLAMLAAEGADPKARELVYSHARFYRCHGMNGNWLDQRESAYTLMAMLSATVLGDGDTQWSFSACWNNNPPAKTMTVRQAAKEILDMQLATQGKLGPAGSLLTLQQTNPSDGANPPNVPWSNLFMTGLLTEAWVMYDRIIGDPRIVPALEAYVNWMWTTQWFPKEKAFAYSNVTINWPNGNAARYPEPSLNGIYLGAWGYVAAKTGKPAYRAQMDEIVAGMLNAFASLDHPYNFFLPKMYPENFRNASQGLGYLQ
jgi:hypothetical protein